MLIEQSEVLELLRQIVGGVTVDPVLQADLMQESLFHLWQVERERPGRTRSWYLQSCRFHLQHWLALGRSLDSPKRVNGNNRIVIDGDDEDPALSEYHTDGELFERICFQDLLSTLVHHLSPRERVVLGGLSEGLRPTEIVSEAGLSYPTVLKYRRNIASLTIKLGISQAAAEKEPNGRATDAVPGPASGSKCSTSGAKTQPNTLSHGEGPHQTKAP